MEVLDVERNVPSPTSESNEERNGPFQTSESNEERNDPSPTPESNEERNGPSPTMENNEELNASSPTSVSHKSSDDLDSSSPILLCLAAIGCILCLGLSLGVNIAMIVFGSMKLNECPAEKYIPIYVIVVGSSGILRALTFNWRDKKKQGVLHSIFKYCDHLCRLFDFIWFICGCVWVYSIYAPSYDKNSPPYCDYKLFTFAFWLLNVSFIMMGLAIFCSCCVVPCCCGKMHFKKNPVRPLSNRVQEWAGK